MQAYFYSGAVAVLMSERSNKSTILLLSLLFPVLVACSGGEAGEPGPASSGSSGVSSPTASELQVWEKRTPAGARAFVRHYIDTVNEAMVSLDSSEMKALAVGSCKTCANWERIVDRTERHDGEIINQEISLTKVESISRFSRRPEFLVEGKISASGYRASPGAKVEKIPPKNLVISCRLEWRAGGWKVATLYQIPVS